MVCSKDYSLFQLMESYRIVLGSSSRYRQRLMNEMGIPFVVEEADIDEKTVLVDPKLYKGKRDRSPPDLLTQAIALEKFRAIADRIDLVENQKTILITGDQVSVFGGEIREKPATEEECRIWMQEYQVQPVECCSSIVVGCIEDESIVKGSVFGEQRYKEVPESIMERLLEEKEILSCCGGYIVSCDTIRPYISERNCSEDVLMGFPKQLVLKLLKEIDSNAFG